MIIWLAMLIPFIGCAIAYKLFPKKFVWWELALPTLICFYLFLPLNLLWRRLYYQTPSIVVVLLLKRDTTNIGQRG